MRSLISILSVLAAIAATGCGSEGTPLDGRTISRVVIRDFNWENHVRTTFTVDVDQVSISDDRSNAPARVVSLTDAQAAELSQLFTSFDRLYAGRYEDEQVADGVNLEFEFHLDNGSVVTTNVSNVRIGSYARLTEYVSSLVEPDIHYHQYDLKQM